MCEKMTNVSDEDENEVKLKISFSFTKAKLLELNQTGGKFQGDFAV